MYVEDAGKGKGKEKRRGMCVRERIKKKSNKCKWISSEMDVTSARET